MRVFPTFLVTTLLILGSLASGSIYASTMLVSTPAEYKEVMKKVRPGDTVTLANGTWKDFEILFMAKGEPDRPITLTAEEKGKVIITGQSNLRLAGEHLVVSGLVFRDGYTPTSEVISFRRNKDTLANHSRVTEVVIDSFNNPERTETDFWVIMYGKNNRFDHNHLAGKSNNGVTMAVRLNSPDSIENHHRIDHNYFGHRPILGSNGGETLRIGTSHYSMSDSFTVVENNYFERCDGEVEIISSKSGNNVFRGNVFFESRGTLTLRHGNDNLVENNVFLGNGVDHTGGIRLINKRQTIRNNYLSGLTGYRFGSALTIMNGVPDSPINRYHQVEDSVVENNSVINSDHIELAAGSDTERSAVPVTTRFQNNLIYNSDGKNIVTIHDDISGITFSGNAVNEVSDFEIADGFANRKIELEKLSSGLMRPVSQDFENVGASADLEVLNRNKTGVDWYPKPDSSSVFGSGGVIPVGSDEGELEAAVKNAGAGDVLELTGEQYEVTRLIRIDRPLTIRGPSGDEDKPLILFERNALFEIADGGSLQLKGLRLSGKNAPDAAGNSLIRTSRYSMLTPYQLIIDDCEVVDLDVNHSFNFLTVAKSTFAFRIEITHSDFRNISGAVLELDKETDDLGLYNVEYVTIADSTFTDIGEALAVLYRGGTDESTFGPHFEVRNTRLSNVGKGKRNKSDSSLSLHGVQVASLFDNEFNGSEPIRMMLTVGEPVTRADNNRFNDTPSPVINGGEVDFQNSSFD